MLVPPAPGSAPGTEDSIRTKGERSHITGESEPSARPNMRISWKSGCLRQCDGDKGPCDGNACAELGVGTGRRKDAGRRH
jgi:hypothetical protein